MQFLVYLLKHGKSDVSWKQEENVMRKGLHTVALYGKREVLYMIEKVGVESSSSSSLGPSIHLGNPRQAKSILRE